MLFGYPVEPDFDLDKEQRQDRVGWVLLGGAVLFLGVYLCSWHSALQLFQAWVATSLCYGASVYVARSKDLRKLWLWKAVSATIPLHLAYLATLFWSDRTFPSVMTKASVFVPVLAIAFAIESILFDRIIDRFEPSSPQQARIPEA